MEYNLNLEQAQESANFIKSQLKLTTNKAVILGSGLSSFIEQVEVIKALPFKEIPHFHATNVVGHAGVLNLVKLADCSHALVLQGRFHYYEGYTPSEVAFPVLVLKLLGVENLIVSNAAGGINQEFQIGDLMIIDDIINFTGQNPLIGKNSELGPRFLDLSNPISPELIKLAHQQAGELNLYLKQGVYLGVTGPNYETKAEIRAFRTLGADAVAMSTIFEVIMANYLKMEVLGISLITNLGTGMLADSTHDHDSVVKNANNSAIKFGNLVNRILCKL